jgi:hypothetical protein
MVAAMATAWPVDVEPFIGQKKEQDRKKIGKKFHGIILKTKRAVNDGHIFFNGRPESGS